MQAFVMPNTIFLTVAGSKMYGTATEESDTDKRGVCIPPYTTTLGFHGFEQQEVPGEDTTIFSLKKFMSLAAASNPNIIELLYAPEDLIEVKKPIWDELLNYRDKFISSKAYHTFCGYAHSQLSRIKTHRNWLLNPPIKKPQRSDFDLPEHGSGIREIAEGVDVAKIAPEVQCLISKERQFKSAMDYYTQYENWKATRNKKRADLEAKFGFDCKHAAHLIRLLRMGYEILTTGEVIVRRPDARELLAIRKGAWTYDELMKNVNELRARLDDVYASKAYVIQREPDINYLSDLCAYLHLKYYREQGVIQ